ncbi:Vitamin B6 photo-protection and homoeostasis family protein [Leishmania donovani]|uniref:Vitamin B6 photo-protection and homoeostasis family protein n=1 Tax=Leishmania donovani TaxID=5661 RepID=A0A504Y1R4_LEIDO|nr:Vitamin B6 photo-protection and homoeostasis family protein [Leishmania donovani]
MLQEYTGGTCVSYRVNPQRGGCVETVAVVDAQDFFGEHGGLVTSPTTPSTPTGPTSARQARRRVVTALERILLPDGYPSSVTEDLLPFALWDLAQVLAKNVTATLSTRAVLLGVGVGESKADLTSSTLSWMMQDGTRMIGSIVFASLIPQGLECRAKTWQLVADFTTDIANLLELCAPWLPGCQTIFRVVLVAASAIKALGGVCDSGTRASFTQHFALRNNAADIAAKAATRSSVGSFIGLALGTAVAYSVPATSRSLNLAAFALCSAFRIFAHYRGVRGVQLRHLNAPRLEWCLEQYSLFKAKVLIAGSFYDSVYRFLRRYCFPATLTLRIHFGASFFRVLQHQNGLTTRRKHELVQQVESALASRGIALLVDDVDMTYYVILPEYFTVEGVPEIWVPHKRQHEAGLTRAAQVEAELERLQKERVVFPPHILPLAYRQLWAYFYAFMHYRAVRLRREGLLTHTKGVLEDLHKNRSLECRRLHIITALRADGTLEADHSDASDASHSPAQFEELTSPTSITSDVPLTRGVVPALARRAGGDDGDNTAAPSHDGLHPHFIEFVRALRMTGWELDELLVSNEGYTTVVNYL